MMRAEFKKVLSCTAKSNNNFDVYRTNDFFGLVKKLLFYIKGVLRCYYEETMRKKQQCRTTKHSEQ